MGGGAEIYPGGKTETTCCPAGRHYATVEADRSWCDYADASRKRTVHIDVAMLQILFLSSIALQ